MDVSEVPMILFTTVAQMCVGAFLVLGVVQTFGSARFSHEAADRIADPALLAIGPVMVLGLAVSMFHMHDVTHTFNVIRHWNSSWLSREILFGTGFAGLGFVFFVLQWLKVGSARLRQLVAATTALVGCGLVTSMSMIYYSLITVPGWHTWFTPLSFVSTTVLLGSLLVGATFVLVRRHHLRLGEVAPVAARPADDMSEATPAATARGGFAGGVAVRLRSLLDAPGDPALDDQVARLISLSVRGIVVAAMVAAAVILVATPVFAAGLAVSSATGAKAAAAYASGLAVARLGLLALGAGLLGLFAYYLSGAQRNRFPVLRTVVLAAFVCSLGAELVGRALFYTLQMRVGM